MKKFALLFVAAFCLPVLGLTGCGGSGETTVVAPTADEEVPGGLDDPTMDAEMEAEMAGEGPG